MRPIQSITKADRDNLEREFCRRSLANFVKRGWRVLEPTVELQWGWALDAICLHLEAVTRGFLIPPRLLINVPPGMMKSLLTSVFWPAWQWGPFGLPEKRILGTSHAADLALRDSGKFRNLITSPWYQALWPMKLRKDTESLIINERLGFREATAFKSMTGKRGDDVILDDPLSASEADSDTERERAARVFRETLQTRLNSIERSSITVIMQRLHERDTAGVIDEVGMPYTKLILPMHYDPERHCRTTVNHNGRTVLFFSDPRKVEGELVFPELFPADAVAGLERDLGSYAAAGQLEQRPAPRGGGILKRHWFEPVGAAPARTQWVRAWDLAGTAKKTSPYTVGLLMGRGPDNTIYIKDVVREQEDVSRVRRFVKNTAAQDGYQVHISIPQDPGQAGKAQVNDFAKELMGYNVHFSPESGDKTVRALPFAAQAEAGNVKLIKGEWNEAFLEEVSLFPNGKFKDQVDAASRGFSYLLEMKAYPLEEAL